MKVELLLTFDVYDKYTDNSLDLSQEALDALTSDIETYLANYDPPGAEAIGLPEPYEVSLGVTNIEVS